ncbi:hypothetical protein FG386_001048 [Cryptosporidium ryanae]|uniref:uncharacterized protein n=1 Tax=Cryptosporidium ryanae TaxID=515981 RepID=UPI00351A6B2C|nr:hypothetical protein FG386_001048 [Cryptosporidium ryanae]
MEDTNIEDIPFEEILRKERLINTLERKTGKKDKKSLNKTENENSDSFKLKKYSIIQSKNLPTEVSSRRQTLPDKLLNEINYIYNKHNNKIIDDPRFKESSGKLNTDLFHKSYEFIDDIKKNEFNHIKNILDLYKSMNKAKELGNWNRIKKTSKFKNSNISHYTKEDIDELKLQYQKLVSENDCRKNLYLKQKTISSHRKLEQSKVEQGKKPFYIKQKDINISVKHEKYKKLNKKQKYKFEKNINKKLSSKFKINDVNKN